MGRFWRLGAFGALAACFGAILSPEVPRLGRSGVLQCVAQALFDDPLDCLLVLGAQSQKRPGRDAHVVRWNGERPLNGVRGFAFGLHEPAFVFAFGADFDRLRARRDFHDAAKLMDRAVFSVCADLQGVAV